MPVWLVYNEASMTYELPLTSPELQKTPEPEKRVWGGWATAGLGLLIMALLFFVLIIVIVIILVVLLAEHSGANYTDLINAHMGLMVSVGGIIAYAAGTGLIFAFIKGKNRAGIAEYLGYRLVSWKVVGIAVLITAAAVALITWLGDKYFPTPGENDMMLKIYNSSGWPALFWIVTVVFAPVFEEAMFRGFLFEGFRNSRLGLVGAIIITSAAWTFFHLGYSAFSLISIFFFGLVLGVVRYKSGSLWSTMLMHALFNAVAMTGIALSAGK